MRFWRHREETTEAFADDAERLPSSEDALVEAPPVEPLPEPEPAQQSAEERQGWFSRLRAGMARSSARLTEGINTIFTRRRLDDEALFELEELLISSDMGTGVAGEVAETLRKTRFNQEVSPATPVPMSLEINSSSSSSSASSSRRRRVKIVLMPSVRRAELRAIPARSRLNQPWRSSALC